MLRIEWKQFTVLSGPFSYEYIDHVKRFPPEKRAVFPLFGWVDPDSDGNFVDASATARLFADLAGHSADVRWHFLVNMPLVHFCKNDMLAIMLIILFAFIFCCYENSKATQRRHTP